MKLAGIIREASKKMNITLAELAHRTNQSPQNLWKKISKETLNYDEFLELLKCMGIQYEYRIKYPGRKSEEMLDVRTRNRIDVLEKQIATQKATIEYLNEINRDIRTGLNVIGGSIDLAKKHMDNSKTVLQCLDKAYIAKNQINALLNDGDELSAITLSNDTMESIRGRKCLLVEDDELSREITRVCLEDSDVIVDEAANGYIALEMALENKYDFILMDMLMPEMDGYEATKNIRLNNNDVPIFALSASVLDEDVQRAKDAGITDYLSKPISINKLIEIVAENLQL